MIAFGVSPKPELEGLSDTSPSPGNQLMSRVSQRKSIRPFRESSDLKATALCVLDITLFALALAAVIVIPNIFVKVIVSFAMGLSIARLFVLGHDACHQSLFANRQANRWIGRLVFLPSLTPYSLWEVGHNLGHHVYTNLRGMDYVWTPLSKTEFDALPRWRQLAERFYRSGYGHGAYYLVELWWRKLFFASRREIPTQRPEFIVDSLLSLVFGIAWISLLVSAAIATQQSVLVLVLTGFVVPFLLWNWIMGAVIYFHHTHPLLAWYNDIDVWEAARDTGCNTVHVLFRGKLGRVLNNIMDHPAHHLDVRIPLYNLEAAHRMLDVPSQITQPFSLRLIRDCVAHCKLYDYDTQRWTDFAGRPTSTALTPGSTASPLVTGVGH
jgi:acyl-lipid omega-6 desaturase (Delta-12 desaturase)